MGMVPLQPLDAPRLLLFCPPTDKHGRGAGSPEEEGIMRTLLALGLLVVTALICPRLWAVDDEKERALAERVQDLNLSDEQEAKIAEIRKDCQPKIREAAKELSVIAKEEEEKIREVLSAEQKEKLQTLKEERKEHRLEGLAARIAHLKDLDLTEDEHAKIHDIQKEYRPRMVKAMEELKGILSEEQKKAREEGLKEGKKRKEVLASLNLTADQKEKVAAICKNMCTVAKEELEKIKDLLTEEQQAKLPELKDERKERVRDRWAHRVANLKDLNLTDEQKTRLEGIRKEYRPKIHEAGNRLRSAIREEAAMIVAIIKG
jgi:Spy/CpxP family protein refolding chaperone